MTRVYSSLIYVGLASDTMWSSRKLNAYNNVGAQLCDNGCVFDHAFPGRRGWRALDREGILVVLCTRARRCGAELAQTVLCGAASNWAKRAVAIECSSLLRVLHRVWRRCKGELRRRERVLVCCCVGDEQLSASLLWECITRVGRGGRGPRHLGVC